MNQDQQAQPTGAQQEAAGQVELVMLDATQTWNADSKLVAFFGGEAAKRVAECSADGVWTVHDEAEFKRLNPAFHALWKQNERQAAEIAQLSKLVYVPGLWRCAKCKCQVVSQTLHVNVGAVSANNEPQECPNKCGPMWRLTERDAGNDLADRLEKQHAEIERLGGLLRDCEAAFAEYQCVVSSVNDPTSFAPKIKDEGNIARKMMKRIRAALEGAK